MLIMIQQMPAPASGYILCFFPLAIIVLGLVTLFFLTDQHASRPYLRFNPFVAANATDEELAQRPPAVGETPAGPLGPGPAGTTNISTGQLGATVTVPQDAVPPSAAPDRPAPPAGGSTPQPKPALGVLPKEAQDALNVDAPGDAKSAVPKPPANPQGNVRPTPPKRRDEGQK